QHHTDLGGPPAGLGRHAVGLEVDDGEGIHGEAWRWPIGRNGRGRAPPMIPVGSSRSAPATTASTRIMDHILERLEQAVAAMARLDGYPHGERRAAWLERLRLNRPELEAFDGLRPSPELGFLGPPASVVAPGGTPPGDDANGIAAIARSARAAPRQAGGPAAEALARARARADLRAFIALADEAMLETALAAALRRLDEGAPLPLLGVPFAVKDLMAVAGLLSTDGTGGPASGPAGTDALAVARLREAGATPIGMANLHELAYGITSENPHHGHVVN